MKTEIYIDINVEIHGDIIYQTSEYRPCFRFFHISRAVLRWLSPSQSVMKENPKKRPSVPPNSATYKRCLGTIVRGCWDVKVKKYTITDGCSTTTHSKAISGWAGLDGSYLESLVIKEHLAVLEIA